MAKLDFPNFQKHLSSFDFERLFVDVLGWNRAPADRAWRNDASDAAGIHVFVRRMVAELGGVAVIQVVMDGGWPDEAQRMRVWKHVSHSQAENLIIFTDKKDRASQSQWYWVKRSKDEITGKPKLRARRHEYFRGQPVDLFASKLQAMVVELSELDSTGRLPVLEAARRIQAALDVDKTTKKFFTSYSQQHDQLLDQIEGIGDDRARRWYASVILNRLMFVWFMQKKFFLDGGNADYLQSKLVESRKRGKDRFFGEFLNALFFEAFAKPDVDRSTEAQQLCGQIPYLNGGLFLHHKLELDSSTHQSRIGTTLRIPDAAFAGVFKVFAAYTWHLDDTPGGDADEINPDVLGYIFEKYINQKAFGAYYTRPEITGYLAERSIHALILERVYEPAISELNLKEIKFDTVADLLARMDARTAMKLVNDVLPSITVLDPAVGSGAFLVAALKCFINVYSAVVGRAELGASVELQNWLRIIQQDHTSVGYYIKRRIVTNNLYGVDIMEEACEIAKLRLFLAMVSSVRNVEHLEPLPNIDFNILPGNSLVGLMRVVEHEFDHKNQGDMFRKSFRELLVEKNRKLTIYRSTASDFGKTTNLCGIRDGIEKAMDEANNVMSELVQDQFFQRGIKFEEATWDVSKLGLGEPKKRAVTLQDVVAQHPLHWGYVFDEIMQVRGGFDIILANPPWEVFKPQAKEFFADHSALVSKNKMAIKEFEREKSKLLKTKEVREAWLEYESRFPHMNQYFRLAPEYRHQVATVNGRKVGSDINLYKLFIERCFNLLRPGGFCGIVIPSGIYTDLGAKGLRDLLFDQTKIQGLFCFENRKTIFEGVDSRFKFVVLTFEKSASPRVLHIGETNTSAPPDDLLAPVKTCVQGTTHFPAAFMRLDVEELARFPEEGAIQMDVELIKRLSPDSHSMMEFKSAVDVMIAHKLLMFPVLGEQIKGTWNLKLHRELHMTDDAPLFNTSPKARALPLVEGKMIHQFEFARQGYKYWVPELGGRKSLIGRGPDEGQSLSYQRYRFAHRSVARSNDERTFISSILPPNVFSGHSLNVAFEPQAPDEQLFLLGVMNSFLLDYYLRQQVSANLTMFFIYQCPVPRLNKLDPRFIPIVQRAARLTCTTPEFEDLAKIVGLNYRDGAIDPSERGRVRAELDGLVAHLYGLSESEFAHILGTFPIVAAPVKIAAQNAFRDVERGLIK